MHKNGPLRIQQLSERDKNNEKWRFFIREAQDQAVTALRCWADFIEAEKCSSVSEMFMHIHHFILHATNIDKILDTSSKPNRRKILDARVNLNGIELKTCRRLRNHLEHFDERLEMWITNYDGHAFFDKNLIAGATGFPDKVFLRALDGHTFKFHGESYDLNEVYTAVTELLDRLKVG